MRLLLSFIRFVPILLFYPIYRNNILLQEDVVRWTKSECSYLKKIIILLSEYKEFRIYSYIGTGMQNRIDCFVSG